MIGASGLSYGELEAQESLAAANGPRVMTSLVVSEVSGEAAGVVRLTGAGGEGPYYQLRLRPGETLCIADRVALPWGLKIVCEAGAVALTVALA